MEEFEKPVINFPNYLASRNGNVYSLFSKRVLKPHLNKNGYYELCLHEGKKQYNKSLHKLILQTFIPIPNITKPCVRHLDGDRSNNHLDNLAWGTHQDNSNDQFRHGTNQTGEHNAAAKLNWKQVKEIRELWREGGLYQYEIGAMYNVSQGIIGKIVTNKLWKDKDYGIKIIKRTKWESKKSKKNIKA